MSSHAGGPDADKTALAGFFFCLPAKSVAVRALTIRRRRPVYAADRLEVGQRVGIHLAVPLARREQHLLVGGDREVTERFAGTEVPRPESWGGFIVRPQRIEFWQGQAARLHDRFLYEREGDGWSIRRLAP